MKNLIQDMAFGLKATANILFAKFTLRQLLSNADLPCAIRCPYLRTGLIYLKNCSGLKYM